MSWQVNVTVNTEVSKDEDVFALRDDIIAAAEQGLDNAEVKFNPSMNEATWNAQIEVLGDKKATTDMDAFSTTIYNYFVGKFAGGQIRLEYRNMAEW